MTDRIPDPAIDPAPIDAAIDPAIDAALGRRIPAGTGTQGRPEAAEGTGCPRCQSGPTVSYGARCGCCACGATWQAVR